MYLLPNTSYSRLSLRSFFSVGVKVAKNTGYQNRAVEHCDGSTTGGTEPLGHLEAISNVTKLNAISGGHQVSLETGNTLKTRKH